MIYSMTGYATRMFSFRGENYKIEMKTLNHRFLDIKLRTPKEWSSLDTQVRAVIEGKLKRGTVDFWVERSAEGKNNFNNEIKVNMPQAEKAMEIFEELKRKFKITEAVSYRDIMSFPDVMIKPTTPALDEEDLSELKDVYIDNVTEVVNELMKMRAHEGEKTKQTMLQVVEQFKLAHMRFLNLRVQIQKRAQEKIKRRIETCFEAYTTPDAQMRALMETRVAQEVAYMMDKTDVDEELTRFKGHVEQIEHLMAIGGLIGKKLDFMFQELSRELNTLGNKAQDLDVSHDVVDLKTGLEQLREQSLNLE